jgi:hypothetical protein
MKKQSKWVVLPTKADHDWIGQYVASKMVVEAMIKNKKKTPPIKIRLLNDGKLTKRKDGDYSLSYEASWRA